MLRADGRAISAKSSERRSEQELSESLPPPHSPSIAVFAFANISGDPTQQYFADGMVEEITTALSRIGRFFVISRNSSFAYQGKSIDARQVGKELGVRYVLEGSIRKAANRLRITTQLIDSERGAHVWAERFEGNMEDVFALQDSVADSVVRAIAPTVRSAEIARARRKRPANLGAYDYYLRALPHWYASTREGNDEALRLLDQGLTLDPTFAQALSVKALVLAYRSTLGWTQPVTSRHSEMLSLAHELIAAVQTTRRSLPVQPISWPGLVQNMRKQSSFLNRLSGWAGTQPLYPCNWARRNPMQDDGMKQWITLRGR